MSLGSFHGPWWALDQAHGNGNWQLLLISQRFASGWGWISCLERNPVSWETNTDGLSQIFLQVECGQYLQAKIFLSSCVIQAQQQPGNVGFQKSKKQQVFIVPLSKCLYSPSSNILIQVKAQWVFHQLSILPFKSLAKCLHHMPKKITGRTIQWRCFGFPLVKAVEIPPCFTY